MILTHACKKINSEHHKFFLYILLCNGVVEAILIIAMLLMVAFGELWSELTPQFSDHIDLTVPPQAANKRYRF